MFNTLPSSHSLEQQQPADSSSARPSRTNNGAVADTVRNAGSVDSAILRRLAEVRAEWLIANPAVESEAQCTKDTGAMPQKSAYVE